MSNEKILIVEDERVVALDIKRRLQALGYVVPATVSTGQEAIQQAIATQPDLVLMDIRLKGDMDGITTAEQIRSRLDLPVVYLTAFSDEAILQRAKRTSPHGYLIKPLNERELHATIETALYRHQAEIEIRQRNRELLALQAASTAISSKLDLQSVLKTVTREMINLLDVESCHISEWNQADDTIKKIAGYVPDGWQGDELEPESYHLTDCPVTQQVLIQQRPMQMTINQPNIDPNELAYFRQAKIQTLLMLPLVFQGTTIGLVNIEDSRYERTFTEHQISLARALANQTAVALENARLFEQAQQEIAERKRTEAELRNREISYQTVVENQTELVCRFLPDTTLTFVNEAYCRYWGKSREELIGKSFLTLIPQGSRQVVQDAIDSLVARPRTEVFEHQYAFPNGRVIWQQWTDQALYDSEGQLVEFQSVGRDVTKRKLAEEALRQREVHYRSLFEDSPIPLYEEDLSAVKAFLDKLRADGITDFGKYFADNPQAVVTCAQLTKILDVNQAALEINRADRKEMLLGELDSYFIEASYEGYRQELTALAAGGKIVSNEIVTQPLGGSQNITISKITILPGYEETWARVLVSSLDITERKRAEEEIYRRNKELALLNQIIAASVTSLEPENFLETICRELAKTFDLGHAAAMLLSQDKTTAVVVAEYCSDQDLSFIDQSFPVHQNPLIHSMLTNHAPVAIKVAQTEPCLTTMYELLNQHDLGFLLLLPIIIDGSVEGLIILGAAEAHPFGTAETELAWTVAGQVAGALSRIRLHKERHQISTVIEQTAESVVITNTAGEIIYVNPAFEQVSGYSRAEVINQNPRILKSGQHPPAFYRNMWDTISRGQIWHGRIRNRKKDGSLFTEEASITPVRDNHGTIINYVAVKRDVTRELQLEEQYYQAQKMEAVALLAGGIAHDFNNLLTAINGFAELLKLQLSSDSPHVEVADKILNAGQRAATLVRQLLTFSRKQVIEPRVLDLNSVMLGFERILARLIGEHIYLTTILEPELGSIEADPTQIEQVILNLGVNARDAMPDGGQLILKTENVVLEESDILIDLGEQPGQYVLLAVSDTGTGMAEAVKARIFEPFFTTKETGKGTGLGLATVYGIVKQNGGFIRVLSQEGQGTTFEVYLPRINKAIPPVPQNEWTRTKVGGTETILLVEDEPDVRHLAARMLRQHGYAVLEAADGQEALKCAQELNGNLQLLITDVIMPGMNGKELADRLEQTHPDLKVLFLSGYSEEMIARHGVLEPHVAFIQKPFTATKLAHKVGEVLSSR